MRLLCDENVPRSFIEELVVRGHAVKRVQESNSGASDEVVLREAVRLGAVLITLDNDFGTLSLSAASHRRLALS